MHVYAAIRACEQGVAIRAKEAEHPMTCSDRGGFLEKYIAIPPHEAWVYDDWEPMFPGDVVSHLAGLEPEVLTEEQRESRAFLAPLIRQRHSKLSIIGQRRDGLQEGG